MKILKSDIKECSNCSGAIYPRPDTPDTLNSLWNATTASPLEFFSNIGGISYTSSTKHIVHGNWLHVGTGKETCDFVAKPRDVEP